MKKLQIFSIITLLVVAFGCNNEAKKESEALKAKIEALQHENEMLTEGTFTMAMSIEDYQETLKQIDAQLAAIDEAHELVKSKTIEFKNDAQLEEEIEMHLKHLHEMNSNAKHKIAHMSKTMDVLRIDNIQSHQKIHELETQTHDMARYIVKRDQEIQNLHNMVVAEGITIMALDDAYTRQQEYSDVLLEIINTGFFVAGTAKKLEEMGIIEKEGGFIGIGRVKTLKANAPVEFITPIDIRVTDKLEFESQGIALITPHAPESYEITVDKESEKAFLEISNKLKFWQETNYLVVELSK